MSTEQEREKAIGKIRKCLALSKSANEHEAAAALRQAQKLMVAFNVSEVDVGLVDYTSSFYDHTAYRYAEMKSIPRSIVLVTALMMRAFEVQAIYAQSPEGRFRVKYYGRLANCTLAAYAHDVVWSAMFKGWRRWVKENPQASRMKGARTSFFAGWIGAVFDKVANLSPSPEEGERIRQKMAKDHPSVQEAKMKPLPGYQAAVTAGRESGASFDLHRPVGTDRNRLEHQT